MNSFLIWFSIALLGAFAVGVVVGYILHEFLRNRRIRRMLDEEIDGFNDFEDDGDDNDNPTLIPPDPFLNLGGGLPLPKSRQHPMDMDLTSPNYSSRNKLN